MTLPHDIPPPVLSSSRIFQPPAASTTHPPPTDYFSPNLSRKRQRPCSSDNKDGESAPLHRSPWSASPSWVQCPTPSDTMYMSVGPAVNEKYRLAGGFDSPGLLAVSEDEFQSLHHDRDFRRYVRDGRVLSASGQDARRMSSQVSGPLARERNGAARLLSSPHGSTQDLRVGAVGWKSFAFGLVGKVFQFGSTVFRGFYAGGGAGYDMHQQNAVSMSDSYLQAPSGNDFHRRPRGTPVPGSWREDDEFLGDFEQDNPNSPTLSVSQVQARAATTPTRPSNKRRQTDRETWVLVGNESSVLEGSLNVSPKRKGTSVTPSRPSLASTAIGRPSASRASSRRSIAPVSRRQSYHINVDQNQQYTSAHAHSHTFQDNRPLSRRASLAPTRSRPETPSDMNQTDGAATRLSLGASETRAKSSPYGDKVSPEATRFLKRQARQDRAADKAMSSMSRRLEDLIRQGQEALGTRVEVDFSGEDSSFKMDGTDGDFDMDEGFVDEEW